MPRFSTTKWMIALGAIAITALVLLAERHRHKDRDNPEVILSQADDLAWDNRWLEADSLYAQAEHEFLRRQKPSKALYAHVSHFIVRAESEPIPPLLVELQKNLALKQARDPDTHLRILVIQGMIETNYDAAMARKTWREVEEIAESRAHYLLMARAMGEQGIAAFLLGDFASAKKLVLRAWIAAKYLHDDAAHVRYASLYGAGLVELHRYNDAITALDEAINTAAHSKGVAYPSIAVNSKIDALRGLGRYSEALDLADKAIERLPSTHLDAHLYQILTSKGEIYGEAGRWDDAVAQYRSALGYARSLKYWRGIVQTGGLLAQVYEKQDDVTNALDTIDEAIRANEEIPQELYFSPRNLAIKAELLDKLGKQKQSRMLHEKSLRLFDSLIATAPTPNVERELLDQMREVYSKYFDSLCREGHIDEAFATVERARGRIEAQALTGHPSPVPHDPTDSEKKITQLNLELIRNDDPNVGAELENALIEANLLLGDTTIAGRASRRPVSLSQVQAHLGPKELLLEYVLDEPISSVLAITAHSVRKYDLPSGKEVGGLSSKYRKEIHDRITDETLAHKLFVELIAPVAEYRDHSDIIVVPDGQLHLLPFASLIEDGQYAVRTHNFTVSPSASVLVILRDRDIRSNDNPIEYVGVAASSDAPRDVGRISNAFFTSKARPLDVLPQSKQEIVTIRNYFRGPATLLVGAEATESNFKALPLDRYRMIHLALHGYADIEYPDHSALIFAPERKTKEDGVLDLREIRHLHLRASLVTLSACDTGVGPISEADVTNLGNAFIEAGAGSVVASLWDLEDRTTAQLMEVFYKNLSLHQSKAEALRNAQLNILAAGLPPYYWASVEVLGDASKPV